MIKEKRLIILLLLILRNRIFSRNAKLTETKALNDIQTNNILLENEINVIKKWG